MFKRIITISRAYITTRKQAVGEGGHNRTVKVKRAVARELCTPGL